MPRTTSAEGGRANWQGIRFEAAFAVLNLVRTAMSRPPLGLDIATARTVAEVAGADFQFQPQANGAVDDLVAMQAGIRVAAYQLKSGIGRVPKAAKGKSATHAALHQAAAEISRVGGAHVVILVFESLSSRLRQVAQWLITGQQAPPIKTRAVLGEIFGKTDAELCGAEFRSRLRIIDCGNATDLGGYIDIQLGTRFSSPRQIRTIGDILRELVAEHSDIEGESKGPITPAVLTARLASRGHPSLSTVPHVDTPVLQRVADQFLANVRRDRGALPKLPRAKCVDEIDVALEKSDVVLLGAGGAGKSEIEAQLLEKRLSLGWTPVVIRRQDLAASDVPLAEFLGAGGTVSTLDVVQHLVQEGRAVLLLIDALDEIRRGSPSTSEPRSQEVYRLLTRIREAYPSRDQLQILLSSRTTDWTYFARIPRPEPFVEFFVPSLGVEIITQDALSDDEEDADDSRPTIASALARVSLPLAAECLARPLLLRFAYELSVAELIDDAPPVDGIRSDAELWSAYYERCVALVDDVPARGFGAGEVRRCHDQTALAHVEGQRLFTSVSDALLRADHDHAYRWLRSLDVLREHVGSLGSSASFFNTSYLDFALANALQERLDVIESFLSAPSVTIALYPVLRLLPAFWANSDEVRAKERTRRMLVLQGASSIGLEALLEGWIDLELTNDHREAFIAELSCLTPGSGRSTPALFLTLLGRTSSRRARKAWLFAAIKSVGAFDDDAVNELLRRAIDDLWNDDDKPVDTDVASEGAAAASLLQDGFARARSLAITDPENARVLCSSASRLLSRVICAETTVSFCSAPLEVSDWPEASNDAANLLATIVRNALAEEAVLLSLDSVSTETAASVIMRIVRGVMRPPDKPMNLTRPMQTEMNFIFQPHDLWQSAWHSLARCVPALIARSPDYVEPVVCAWLIFGLIRRNGELPKLSPDSYWIDDRSENWWHESTHHLEHAQIAEAGFGAITAALQRNDPLPFRRLIVSARRERWGGLAAILLDLAGHACVDDVIPVAVKQQVADAVVQLCLEGNALDVASIRRSFAAEFCNLLPFTTEANIQPILTKLANLASPARIAGLPLPTLPDLAELEAEHAAQEAELKERATKAAQDPDSRNRHFDAEQIKLQLLAQLTPEYLLGINQRLLARATAWRDTALTGVAPIDHPDVRFAVSALKHALLVEVDIPSWLMAAIHEARALAAPVAMDASSSADPERAEFVGSVWDDDDEEHDARPRARFVRECERIANERINQRAPMERGALEALLALIERNQEVAGLDEPSLDYTHEGATIDFVEQPFPKRGWLQLVVTYLEGLPPGTEHSLSATHFERILSLAADPDPFGQEPASSSHSTAVRVLAANALVQLKAHNTVSDQLDDEISTLANDPAPSVRRALFDAIPVIGKSSPKLYARQLRTYAEFEQDPFILSWAGNKLFTLHHDDLLTEFDTCAAILVPRVAQLYAVESSKGIECDKNPYIDALRRAVAIAVKVAANIPTGQAERMLTVELATTPAVSSYALETIFSVIRSNAKNADAFAALVTHVRIPVPITTNSLVIRDALEHAHNAGAALAASLLNLSHVPKMPMAAARERVNLDALRASPLWKYRPHLRAKWIEIVSPWMTSDHVLSSQRLISDAAIVLDIEARLDPMSAAGLLTQLRLDRAARFFEQRLADQLADLAAYLLIRCDTLKQQECAALVSLINVLASVGNARASQAARAFAVHVRIQGEPTP